MDKGIKFLASRFSSSDAFHTFLGFARNYRDLFLVSLLCASVFCLTSCSDDDEPNDDNSSGEITDDGDIVKIDSVELFSSRDGKKIYGVMYRNVAYAKKVPAVILSHSSSLTHEAMSGYALHIAEKGYAAYCFDFCGGSSDSKSEGSTDEMTVFTEIEDLRAVASTVRKQTYVDSERVFLMGSSQGGLVSALLADQASSEFSGMILLYPAFNIPELVRMFSSMGGLGGWGGLGNLGGLGDLSGMGGMITMNEAFISSIKDYNVWDNIGKFSKPVCIIHGTSDFIVPISNSEKAVALYPNATLHRIEGANHGFNAANLGATGSIIGVSTDYDSQVIPLILDYLEKASR